MYFSLQNEIIDWFTKQGIEFDLAAKYVTSLNEGLGAIAAKTAPSELKHLPVAHETPGGLNESVRTNLEKAKWPAKVSEQLDYLINVFIPGLKNKK
jgi:pyrroline-5-carboxylate reductase